MEQSIELVAIWLVTGRVIKYHDQLISRIVRIESVTQTIYIEHTACHLLRKEMLYCISIL